MPAKKKSNSTYERRDRAFLAHVARYRAGLYPCISNVLWGERGKPVGSIAGKLERQEPSLVKIHQRAIDGGISLLGITRAGARKLGTVPVKRGLKVPSGAALDQAIGISVFCCLGEVRRYRFERSEMVELFGKDAPADNVPHVASDESGAEKVYRVFQGTAETGKAVKRLREVIELVRKTKAIRPWLLQRDYGFLVLSPTERGREALEKAVEASGLRDDYEILTGLGPTAETLKAALRKSKGRDDGKPEGVPGKKKGKTR